LRFYGSTLLSGLRTKSLKRPVPELPEVETVRRGLAPVMEGARFARVTLNRPDLRFPFAENFAARIEDTQLTRLTRRAKFLRAELSSGETLYMHLGMSGRFIIEGDPQSRNGGLANFAHEHVANPKHHHVIFEMEHPTAGRAVITYNDPRRFGFMELIGETASSAISNIALTFMAARASLARCARPPSNASCKAAGVLFSAGCVRGDL